MAAPELLIGKLAGYDVIKPCRIGVKVIFGIVLCHDQAIYVYAHAGQKCFDSITGE